MKSILLIDDNPDNLLSLRAVLSDLFPDTEVFTAFTGRKGIELANTEDPDVILLDIIMPEMDGFEVCRQLKSNSKLNNIPVVFITAAKESREKRMKAVECGAEAFLYKPIDETELFLQVKAMFKIRASNISRLEEFSRLEDLVKKRTEALERELGDRIRLDEQLRENEAIFSQFMEHSPVYVFFKDDQIRSLRLSRNYETMLGRKLEELLGKNMDELFPSDLAKEMVRLDQQILEKGEKVQVDEVLHGRNYTTIKFPIQVDGEHRFLAGFTIDITERKSAEDALKNSEARLIELNATKDKFFSIISHDLKSPFNSLLGFSNLLVDQIEKKNYQGIEEYARIIQLSSKRVMELLENLLQWSRSQTGRIEFSPEFFELDMVIREVTELLNDTALQKNIKITNASLPKTIAYADKYMLGTILRNLISNAIKFTHSGGDIRITAEQDNNELLVSIADNGVGIPNGMIPKLFKIEESFTTAGTLKEHGTGLGLILCKDFVEKHGGRIWVESNSQNLNQNGGSTFRFTIPMTKI